MMSAQSLASFCCSKAKRWCSWHSSQAIARCTLSCSRARSPGAPRAGRGNPRRAATTAWRRCSRDTRSPLRGCSCRRTSRSARWAPGARPGSAGRWRPPARDAAAPLSAIPRAHTAASRREHRAVAAGARPRSGRGGEDAVGGEVALQQRDRLSPALLDQLGVIGQRLFASGHGVGVVKKKRGHRGHREHRENSLREVEPNGPGPDPAEKDHPTASVFCLFSVFSVADGS